MKLNFDLKYKNLREFIEKQTPFKPDLGLILGSGLGDFAESLDVIKTLSTAEVPDYPTSTVKGHKGFIHFAQSRGKNILLFQGRVHLYEGYSISDALLPVYISKLTGTKNLILTNAAGGINSDFKPGDLMLITDFFGWDLKRELTRLLGLATVKYKDRLLNLPSSINNSIIKEAALQSGVDLKEGSYWYSKGPSYETPAEIKMMAVMGADSVGMSTVHEAIFAAINGIETSAISLISNLAAGLSKDQLSHQEVVETAAQVKPKFEKLIKKIIELS